MFSSPFPHIYSDVHMGSGSEVKRNKIIKISCTNKIINMSTISTINTLEIRTFSVSQCQSESFHVVWCFTSFSVLYINSAGFILNML